MATGSRSGEGKPGQPAVLGQGLRVVGRVRGNGDLRVGGQVEGDIAVVGQLEIEPAAAVSGNVEARGLRVSGTLQGDSAVEGTMTIGASGRVSGKVSAAELVLDEGASFDGQVDTAFDLPEPLG